MKRHRNRAASLHLPILASVLGVVLILGLYTTFLLHKGEPGENGENGAPQTTLSSGQDNPAALPETEAGHPVPDNTAGVSHGPFVGYVADAQTPWIELYTEIDGTYVGQIPYAIFHDWIATDRSREGWTPGWEPSYIHFYYAEFGNFRWAAAHLTDTTMGNGRKNVATSSDGGETWDVGSTQDDYGGNHVVGMGFLSERLAFMSFDPQHEYDSKDGVVISRTTDGGESWERLQIGTPDILAAYEYQSLIPGIPFQVDGAILYPVTLGYGEENKVYLISYDSGNSWVWSLEDEINRLAKFVPPFYDRASGKEYLVAAVYGEGGVSADAAQISPLAGAGDGAAYVTYGEVGEGPGDFCRYYTYRVTCENGVLTSVGEAETVTRETVLEKGNPYRGTLDGEYRCEARGKDRLMYRFVKIAGDTVWLSSYVSGTGNGGTFSGTYTYDPDTGRLQAKLRQEYVDNAGNARVGEARSVSGKLYEYGGRLHFLYESGEAETLSPDDPLPLTFALPAGVGERKGFSVRTIPVPGGMDMTLSVPDEWRWDGTFFTQFGVRNSGPYPDAKRIHLYHAYITLARFEAGLEEANTHGGRVYQLDAPITGVTGSGLSYTGYFGDEKLLEGETSRRYLFYIPVDGSAYVLEIWQRLEYDGENFFADAAEVILESLRVADTEKNKVIRAYHEATDAASWFRVASLLEYGSSAPLDVSDSFEENGIRYFRVPHTASYSAFVHRLRGLFSRTLTEKLLAYNGPMYTERDGKLYGKLGLRGTNIRMGAEDYAVVKISDTRYDLTVTVEVLGDDMESIAGYKTFVFPYEYTDGGWVFTSFPEIR